MLRPYQRDLLPKIFHKTSSLFESIKNMVRLLGALLTAAIISIKTIAATTKSSQFCKITPFDKEWPSVEEWSSLNISIGGALLKTVPVASSCYDGNPFSSSHPCDEVENDWTLSTFHASLPESIDYPIYANNSCLPPTASGYTKQKGCAVGALPQYIINATTEEQVATAVLWASSRNIRIVVKGTGRDMNGR